MEQATARALDRAIAFLEARQLPSGEIPVLAGGKPDPSVFPTALAAHALSFAPGATALRARVLDFLAREMRPGALWKHWARSHPFSAQLPADLDDTSCASSALIKAGRGIPDNHPTLLRNRSRTGRFFTWKLTAAQLRHPVLCALFFLRTSARPFDVDAVVNANVVFYLGERAETRASIEWLLEILRDERERTCDKWYENPFVVWYFFSRALRTLRPEAGPLLRSRLKTRTPTSALESALALCTTLDWSGSVDLAPLLDTQLPSGGWPAAGLYHGGRKRLGAYAFAEPHPDTPWWGSEELTTVFCIEALARGAAV